MKKTEVQKFNILISKFLKFKNVKDFKISNIIDKLNIKNDKKIKVKWLSKKVVKNKVAPPFTACEFDIMYNEGISRTGSVIDLGIDHNILSKKGAWISYEGELVGQGREAAKQTLAENPEMMEKITSSILEKVQVSVGSVLAQGDTEEEA